jgi:hypothetical protein
MYNKCKVRPFSLLSSRLLIMSSVDVKEDDQCRFYDLLLCESLTAALQHPRCARASWLQEGDDELRHLSLSDDEQSVYWIDKEKRKLSFAFPAVLDLDGAFA